MKSKKKSTDPIYKSRFDAAITLYRTGRVAQSVEALKLVAIDYPNSPAVHGYLGLVLMKVGQPELAARHFEVATHLSPTNETASLGLFHALLETGEKKLAIVELKRFQSVSHSDDYDAIAADMGIRIPVAA